MSISAIYCCMDREKNLRFSIKSVLQFKEISEIIILDYGSKIPIKPFSNKKIQLYRRDSEYWHLTKAYNIAAQLTNNDTLIKLDSDYILKNNFFKKNILEKESFICGDKQQNQHLAGFLMIKKNDFMAINGYNELIVNYGYDDDDIKIRLIARGLKSINVDHNTISHIDHDDISRKINNQNQKLSFVESVMQNQLIADQYNWSSFGKMSTL